MSLDYILEQLDNIDMDAADLNYPVPFRPAYRSAEKLINEFYEVVGDKADVMLSPTQYGEIAINVLIDEGVFQADVDSSGAAKVVMASDNIDYIELQFTDDENIGECFRMFVREVRGECEKCKERRNN